MLARVNGLNIPLERIELLTEDKAKYEAQIDVIEYLDISPEDFEVEPSSAPTHVATVQLLSAPKPSLHAELLDAGTSLVYSPLEL